MKQHSLSEIQSGTHIPSFSSLTNLDGVATTGCRWVRIGDTVIVSGEFAIDVTTASVVSSFIMDLPLPPKSNFLPSEVAGTGKSTNDVWRIRASGVSAVFDCSSPQVLGSAATTFMFTYKYK